MKVETAPTSRFVQIEQPYQGQYVGCLGQNEVPSLDDLTATDLRELAEDALAAAEWLDVNALPAPPCPSWCRDVGKHGNYDVVAFNEDGTMRGFLGHSGPTFGPFGTGANGDILTGALDYSVSVDTVVLQQMGIMDEVTDPAVLEQLADDARAAAEWLEANR